MNKIMWEKPLVELSKLKWPLSWLLLRSTQTKDANLKRLVILTKE